MAKDDLPVSPPVMPNGMHPYQMVSIAQFAALKNISKDTVRRGIRKGRIAAKKVSERRIAIPASELLK
jgi:hypothetical protein